MNIPHRWLCEILLVGIAGLILPALAAPSPIGAGHSPRPDVPAVDVPKFALSDGSFFITEGLGTVDPTRPEESAKDYVQSLAPTGPDGRRSNYEFRWVRRDSIGKGHVNAQQYWRGLPIAGAELRLHMDWEAGQVEGLNGRLATLEEAATEPRIPWALALENALKTTGLQRRDHLHLVETPILAYVVDEGGKAQLAWKASVSYEADGDEQLDHLYIHAETARVIAVHPQHHYALNRKIYDAGHNTSIPGVLALSEGGTSADAGIQGTYVNLGVVYNYYFQRHGRDSFDGTGGTIEAVVHYSNNYNNLFWNGSRLIIGDGDGITFSPFGLAVDLVAHEYTHAVIERTAGLVYSGESGAINEGLAYFFGACTRAFRDGALGPQTWRAGEEVFTPAVPGDAITYLDDPARDGLTRDFYPERFLTTDNNATHLNAGIANLAFVLMVQGGSHPRGKTTTVVPALGLNAVEQILFRALRFYATSTSTFEQMRLATAHAASDLFGPAAEAAVHAGWDAVGVPNPVPPPPTIVPLTIGVPSALLSAPIGTKLYFQVNIPAGAGGLTVSLSGPTGDADLYVRFGSLPTLTGHDCASTTGDSTDSCSFSSPSAGAWFVMVHASAQFANAQLTATLTPPANQPPMAAFDAAGSGLLFSFLDGSTDPDGSIASRVWNFGDGTQSTSIQPTHTYATAGSYTVTLTVQDDDGAVASMTKKINTTTLSACPTCFHYFGALSGPGAVETEPLGEGYYASAGIHEGFLQAGRVTNFDLYLYKLVLSKWLLVARSEGASSNESIRYDGSPGFYLWQIRSMSGAGLFDFWLRRP